MCGFDRRIYDVVVRREDRPHIPGSLWYTVGNFPDRRYSLASKLVIVESPSKAKTIEKFLGPDYQVMASVGHVIDLPAKGLGVDTRRNFAPKYVVIPGKEKILSIFGAPAKRADEVFLAPDPDREGEAISAHLARALEIPHARRAVFNEITKNAVREAIEHPREIDDHLVNAQQARRILDRLVGYKISPLLWRRVQKHTSAGRVQSVAVRLIVDREEIIRNFVPEEYWTLDGPALEDRRIARLFSAELVRDLDQSEKEKLRIGSEERNARDAGRSERRGVRRDEGREEEDEEHAGRCRTARVRCSRMLRHDCGSHPRRR